MASSHTDWSEILGEEKTKPYFQSILTFLENERTAGKVIYPPKNEIFFAFKETPYDNLKVVILGQDPYHGPGQAHGLAFSVKPKIKFPPSLRNIFQELKDDLNLSTPKNGCLTSWANQGVLLLNTSLSVEQGKPQSHGKIGWTIFTDSVIRKLNDYPQKLVFLLWGAHAQRKRFLLNEEKHLILSSSHPSPLSVYQGFKGCKHFSKTNEFLKNEGRAPIEWGLK